MATTTWAIAEDRTTDSGEQRTSYWCGPEGVVAGFDSWTSLEACGGSISVATWFTKHEAEDAYCKAYGYARHTMASGHRAVKLTREQIAVMRGETPPPQPPPAQPARKAQRKRAKKTVKPRTRTHLRGGGTIELTLVPAGTPKNLDKQIRLHAREIDRAWNLLEPLIAEAKTRGIHADLGFKSWPDYIADVARTEMPNVSRSVDQRRQVVELLAGEGMSNRAIADAVGVNEITVRRDKDEVRHDVAPEPTDDAVPTDVVAAESEAAERVDADLARLREAVDAEVAESKPITGRDGKSYPGRMTLDERNKLRAAQGLPPIQKARKLTAPEVVLRDAKAIAADFGALAARMRKLWVDNRAIDQGYRPLDDFPDFLQEAWEELDDVLSHPERF